MKTEQRRQSAEECWVYKGAEATTKAAKAGGKVPHLACTTGEAFDSATYLPQQVPQSLIMSWVLQL